MLEPPPDDWLTENARDGGLLVLIPAGEFTMGSEKNDREKPVRRVHLDAYRIGINPVTVGQFRRYCQDSGLAFDWAGRKPDWGWVEEHPMVRVTWEESRSYCVWAGGDLPTEAQWEKAARGPDGRVYPWGNDWGRKRCRNSVGTRAGSTSSVWSYPSGASPYGILDMAGNVWEWCLDWYASYSGLPDGNPSGPASGGSRVLRGGSWFDGIPVYFRSSGRSSIVPTTRGNTYGFRFAGPP